MLNQFNKNMESIKTSKNNPCKFSSLLTCLFFSMKQFFPSKGSFIWRQDVPILYQINEYIANMGENFVNIMDNYFDSFKENINNRFIIPKKLEEYYKDDVCFMVGFNKVQIQVVKPGVVWVKPLSYEVNIDDTRYHRGTIE